MKRPTKTLSRALKFASQRRRNAMKGWNSGGNILHKTIAADKSHFEVNPTNLKKFGTHILNEKDTRGRTPLVLACKRGNLAFVTALISAGADITITNDKGQTDLHVAVRYCHFEIVKFLLENGADLTAEDSKGQMPFQVQARHIQEGVSDIIGANRLRTWKAFMSRGVSRISRFDLKDKSKQNSNNQQTEKQTEKQTDSIRIRTSQTQQVKAATTTTTTTPKSTERKLTQYARPHSTKSNDTQKSKGGKGGLGGLGGGAGDTSQNPSPQPSPCASPRSSSSSSVISYNEDENENENENEDENENVHDLALFLSVNENVLDD
eukprot:c20418_g1_i2.p1 GENE.c20418_g1_i2~~c20418_g1_i2.p1  ORF type:complete len:336 (-),score=153.10 c20418_g1_i2:679-1641(-)